jgi:hypothetical protein
LICFDESYSSRILDLIEMDAQHKLRMKH